MKSILKKSALLLALLSSYGGLSAQTDDIEKILEEDTETKPKIEYIRNAFKSTRVINGHSMEMLGEGVLDFRILHRFGMFKGGFKEFFGLDQATMRMGFDYGITRNLTIGIGRSTFKKEYDGFVKYRILHQRKGDKPMPVSLIWVSGMTVSTASFSNSKLNTFSNRVGYYHQAIVGRKFSEGFTLQLSPTFVHRNLVEKNTDKNDMLSMGVGARIKVSKRSALILDTYPILYGATQNVNQFPLSIGMDIETGGHVFQLHITNARGMNERAFITETFQQWDKGEIQFGFNLSRVFSVKKNTATSW